MPMQPYANNSTYDWYEPQLEVANPSGYQHDDLQIKASSVMLVGQYPQQRMNALGYPPRQSPQTPSNVRSSRYEGAH